MLAIPSLSRPGLRLAFQGAAFVVALATAMPAMAQSAGKFLVSIGEVKLVGKDGTTRIAERGGELREGDTIVTGANGLAQIRLQDNGLISVRANTEMKLDKFAFAGQDDTKASLLISLAKGGLRSITGLIGKANRAGYRISTATATIGIRGTDHEPFYIPPGQTALGAPGTYDKVNSGMTVIQGRQGNPLEVSINQVAFVPPTGAAPVILPSVPQFYKQDLAVPDPQARKAPANDTPAKTDGDGSRSTDTVKTVKSVDSVDIIKSTDSRTLGTLRTDVLDNNVKVKTDVGTTALTPIDRTVTPVTSTVQTTLTPITTVTTPITTTVLQTTPTVSTTLQTAPLTSIVAPTTTTTVAPTTTTTILTPITTTVSPILTTPLLK